MSMKKWMMILFCFLSVQTAMFAASDTDKLIRVKDLPAVSQQILTKHFAGKKVALVKQETELFDRSYDVIFTNGDKIEFDKAGNWTEIDCKYSKVPAALVPQAISKYVQSHYPGKTIQQIEKKRRTYEVELSGGLEITFNSKFQVTEID